MPGYKSYPSLSLPCYVNLACCYLLCILVFICKIENNISLPLEVALKMNWENICKCSAHCQVHRSAQSWLIIPHLFSPGHAFFPSAINEKCTSFRFRQMGIWIEILPLTICGSLRYFLFSPRFLSFILNTGIMTLTLYGDPFLWFFPHLAIQGKVNEYTLCLVPSQGREVELAV